MKHFRFLILVLIFVGCRGPEPRRPVKVKTVNYIKETVERNKKLLAKEEKKIQDIIAKDSVHTYRTTANSSWYYYDVKIEEPSIFPQADDVVTLTYNIVSFDNDTIYSNAVIDTIIYKVDKIKLFPGLRNSIKLLKENETATFMFPSSMAFGYRGDNDKIEPNTPIKSTITLLKIERQKDSI